MIFFIYLLVIPEYGVKLNFSNEHRERARAKVSVYNGHYMYAWTPGPIKFNQLPYPLPSGGVQIQVVEDDLGNAVCTQC